MLNCCSFPGCCRFRRWTDVIGIRIIALVDMPEATRHERKVKREFREWLFADGFSALQEGVYTRIANGYDHAAAHLARIRDNAPGEGTVRIFALTEAQFRESELVAGHEGTQETEIGSELDIFL